MTGPDPRDHALDVLLDEALGGVAPPDLLARILDATTNSPTTDPMDTMTHTAPVPAPVSPADESFELVASGSQRGLAREFLDFMAENSKWWLIPFLVVFGMLGMLLVLGATGAAPFIYALF
ncbi:MAG: hypothetical protein HZB39_17445 [Planctomycetes bacterium]|nr:hypothetical protein [Planctomycetota bacterium]